MGSKVNFNEVEARDVFSTSYSHLGEIVQIEPLNALNINSMNYVVDVTEGGRYLLRKYGDFQWYHTKNQILHTFDVMNTCESQGIKVPKMIASSRDERIVEDKGSLYSCFSFIESVPYTHHQDEIKSVAQNLAKIHLVLRDLTNSGESEPFLEELLTLDEVHEINGKMKLQQSEERQNFFDLVTENLSWLQAKIDENQTYFAEKRIKVQWTHGDFHKDNVLFYNHGVAAILDFDSMKVTQRVRELGFAAQRFCRDTRELQLFLDSYTQVNPLDLQESESLKYLTLRESLRRASKILRMAFFHDKWHFGNDLHKQISNARNSESLFEGL